MTIHGDEEKQGIRRLSVGIGVLVVAVIGIGLFFWLWSTTLDRSNQQASTTDRSEQLQGASDAGRRSAPPPDASATGANSETVGRAQDIAHSATGGLSLTDDQRKAVSEFAEHHRSRTTQPDFTLSVGAAVPHQVELGDLPVDLTDKLWAYSGDQFFLAPSRLVVVERETRRIVAVIPTGT